MFLKFKTVIIGVLDDVTLCNYQSEVRQPFLIHKTEEEIEKIDIYRKLVKMIVMASTPMNFLNYY